MAVRTDLNGILSTIRTLLVTANTTTASPIDLSQDMTTRVQKVLQIHPQKIPVQASFFPYVTCYISKKSISSPSIAKDQLSAKKKAIVEVDVVGAVWNDQFLTDTEDPADKDIHSLMENIELALRANANLDSKATWQLTDDVNYYDARIEENVHLRAGVLSLKATIYY